jgi:hypothetical protein
MLLRLLLVRLLLLLLSVHAMLRRHQRSRLLLQHHVALQCMLEVHLLFLRLMLQPLPLA